MTSQIASTIQDTDIATRLETAKQQKSHLQKLMESLSTNHSSYIQTRPDKFFATALEQLKRTQFNIAFCGKVNSGKSTLLNTLVGRNIMPTGDRPLTAQIVILETCEKDEEEFKIAYDNGKEENFPGLDSLTEKVIEAAQRPDGPQVGTPQDIEYVLIRCFIQGLPQGIRFVDTPGIGSSYEHHSLLSENYLKDADALVYVLKSDIELTQTDVPLLKRAYQANKNIIFVQTASDAYPERASIIEAQNKELIRKYILEQQIDIPLIYHTVSAKNYSESTQILETTLQNSSFTDEQKAAIADMLIKLKRKPFHEFTDDLAYMIYKTVGIDSINMALIPSFYYVESTLKHLNEQKAIAESTISSEEICEEVSNRITTFVEKWGEEGSELHTFYGKINEILTDTEAKLSDSLSPDGSVANELCQKVDLLSSGEEIKTFADSLGSSLQDIIKAEWTNCLQECTEKTNNELAVFHKSILGAQTPCITTSGLSILCPPLSKMGFSDALRAARLALHLVTGNFILVTLNIGGWIVKLWKSEKQKEAARDEIKEQIRGFFRNVQKTLIGDEQNENSPVHKSLQDIFTRTQETLKKVLRDQYRNIGIEGAQLLQRAEEDTSTRKKTIENLVGTPEKPGIIATWERTQTKLQEIADFANANTKNEIQPSPGI